MKSLFFSVGDFATYKKKILEKDVLLFADLSGDHNPVHIDEQEASKTIFKKRVVHGAFISSLFSTILGTELPGKGSIYLEQFSRYVKPVYFNDEVEAKVTVSEIDEIRHRMKLETTAYNQNGDLVCKGHAVVLLP